MYWTENEYFVIPETIGKPYTQLYKPAFEKDIHLNDRLVLVNKRHTSLWIKTMVHILDFIDILARKVKNILAFFVLLVFENEVIYFRTLTSTHNEPIYSLNEWIKWAKLLKPVIVKLYRLHYPNILGLISNQKFSLQMWTFLTFVFCDFSLSETLEGFLFNILKFRFIQILQGKCCLFFLRLLLNDIHIAQSAK